MNAKVDAPPSCTPVEVSVVGVYGAAKVPSDIIQTRDGATFVDVASCQSSPLALWNKLNQLATMGFVAVPARSESGDPMTEPTNWAWATIGADSGCQECGPLGARGAGESLCQLDTGYTENAFFRGNGRALIEDPKLNFIEHDGHTLPEDPGVGGGPIAKLVGIHNHGTGAASVAVAASNATFSGIAPRADFIPLRVSPGTVVFSGYDLAFMSGNDERHFADGFRAIARLADIQNRASERCDVISIAQGAALPYFPLWQGLVMALRSGAIVVSAAGQVPKVSLAAVARIRPAFPARYAATGLPVVAVGGITPSGRPWTKAFRGEAVDISAPATNIRHVAFRTTPSGQRDAYIADDGEGTTFATGFTAGSALLWLQKWGGRRGVLEHYGDDKLPPIAIPCAFRMSVRRSAQDRGQNLRRQGFGHGVLSVPSLMALPLPPVAAIKKCIARFEDAAQAANGQLAYGSNDLEGWEQEEHPTALKRARSSRSESFSAGTPDDELNSALSTVAAAELSSLVDNGGANAAGVGLRQFCENADAFGGFLGGRGLATDNLIRQLSRPEFVQSLHDQLCGE